MEHSRLGAQNALVWGQNSIIGRILMGVQWLAGWSGRGKYHLKTWIARCDLGREKRRRSRAGRRSSSSRRSRHGPRSALVVSVATSHGATVPACSRSSTNMRLPRDLMRLNRCGESKALAPHPSSRNASWGIVEGCFGRKVPLESRIH
jgi:hypothetical protein